MLHLEDELMNLKSQLEELDSWEALTENSIRLQCWRLNDAVSENSERRKLLQICEKKLKLYDMLSITTVWNQCWWTRRQIALTSAAEADNQAIYWEKSEQSI